MFMKKPKYALENKEMVFENGVKNIQAAAFNGVRTVIWSLPDEFLVIA